MQLQRRILWAGKFFAAAGYALAALVIGPFLRSELIPSDEIERSLWLVPWILFGVGTIAAAIIGPVLTAVALASFPVKWWRESRGEYHLAASHSPDGAEGALWVGGILIGTTFALGIFSPFIEERVLATMVAVASLPAILQTIENMRPPVQQTSQISFTEVPDE